MILNTMGTCCAKPPGVDEFSYYSCVCEGKKVVIFRVSRSLVEKPENDRDAIIIRNQCPCTPPEILESMRSKKLDDFLSQRHDY